MNTVLKLSPRQVCALRAAKHHDLIHSRFSGIDWIRYGTPGEGRVTIAAAKLRAGDLIRLPPNPTGDEQLYEITDAGRTELVKHLASSKRK